MLCSLFLFVPRRCLDALYRLWMCLQASYNRRSKESQFNMLSEAECRVSYTVCDEEPESESEVESLEVLHPEFEFKEK